MARTPNFSVKFTPQGLQDTLKASQQVSRSYLEWLEDAEKAIKEVNDLSEEYADDQEKIAQLEKQRSKAGRDANRALQASWRELESRSSQSIEEQRSKAISAFEAIKRSGVASAEDIARAQEALDRKLQKIDRQLQTVENSAKDAGDGFTIMSGSIAGVISQLGADVFRGAINGLKSIITQAVGVRTQFSKLRDQISLIEGGELQGAAVFQQLQKFNTQTPFELEEVTNAYVKLANRGVKPTNEELTKLGDLALSQNKSLDQLVEAVLDAQTGENERLKEFGIRASKNGDNVSLAFKGITQNVELTEEAVYDAILAFGELDGITGNIEKASNRLDGVGSNISDVQSGFFDTIGGIFEPLLVAGGKVLVDVISPITDPALWAPIGDAINAIVEALTGALPSAETFQEIFAEGIATAIEFIAALLFDVARILEENPALIEDIIDGLAKAGETASLIAAGLALAASTVLEVIAVTSTLKDGLESLSLDFLMDSVDATVGAFQEFIATTQINWRQFVADTQESWSQFTGNMRDFFINAWNALTAAAVSGWQAIQQAAQSVIDAILGFWRALTQQAIREWEALRNVAVNAVNFILSELQKMLAFWINLGQQVLGIWNNIREAGSNAISSITDLVQKMLEPFKEIAQTGSDIGKNIIAWANPLEKARGILDKFKDGFLKILGLSKNVGTDVGEKLESTTATGGPLLPAPEGSFSPKSFPVTSRFGPRNGRLHAGTDYGTPQGTPLGNIFGGGIITRAGYGVGGYGGLIELSLPTGEVYRFGHMSDIRVRAGQQVPAGALLGLTGGAVGSRGAGRSTGPHLHLEYYPRGLDGGAVDFQGTGRGGPTLPMPLGGPGPMTGANNIKPFGRDAKPHKCGANCPIHGRKTRRSPGTGGPSLTKHRIKIGRGGPTSESELKKQKREQERAKKKAEAAKKKAEKVQKDLERDAEKADELLSDALTALGIESEIDGSDAQIERQVRDEFKAIFEDLDDATKLYEDLIKRKKELKQATDDEEKALKKITETRDKSNELLDSEIKKALELQQLRRNVAAIERTNATTSLETEFLSIQADNALRTGQISQFDVERLNVERRIVEQMGQHAQQLAELRTERAQTDDQDQINHIDTLIDRYGELNDVKLDALAIELDEIAEAQRETTRILPNAEELASTLTGSLREIPGLITDVITGAQSFGDAILGLLSSIAQRFADLFLNRGFDALEGLLGGLFGSKQSSGSGLFSSGIGALIGGASGSSGGSSGISAGLAGALGAVGATDGAVLPGFGGGDRNLFLLEDGEAVLPKELVRAIGPDQVALANDTMSPAALLSAGAIEALNFQMAGAADMSTSNTTTTINNRVTIKYNNANNNNSRPTERQLTNDLSANLQRYGRNR